MKDHLVLIESPQDDARALAIVAEAKNLVANKPLKYVVNSHKHFDHSGGLAALVAEGVTVVTHESNKAFFERSLAAPRTVQPDKLAQAGKKPVVEVFKDKHVISDGARMIELHPIQGNNHDESNDDNGDSNAMEFDRPRARSSRKLTILHMIDTCLRLGHRTCNLTILDSLIRCPP